MSESPTLEQVDGRVRLALPEGGRIDMPSGVAIQDERDAQEREREQERAQNKAASRAEAAQAEEARRRAAAEFVPFNANDYVEWPELKP